MKITHWLRKENSGLMRSALELADGEEKAGAEVCIRTPSDNKLIYGEEFKPDIHVVHSQLHPSTYHDGVPKVMIMHGEPLSSVANGISMKAIVDLAPLMDCFICMRREEQSIWNSIKRTYVIDKGIDLDVYRPLDPPPEKLAGDPVILYSENWRRERNPLYLCIAMLEVIKVFPDARLHLYNCQDQKLYDTFKQLINHNKWWAFIRSIRGPVDDINELYNKADIVVSCLNPLYARSVEALGAGKAFICPGYRSLIAEGYPYHCSLDPTSIASAIKFCWDDMKNGANPFDFRQYAEEHHCHKKSAKQAIEIYERYL